ncbi:MOSC domain-containing protein [Agrobacterium sp. a22-2]|uniref:MOSC domain-containing protein n=1 Tax=Agrobacterium sp. a22-2 TaxID=2283840 RepID=UPI001444AC9C|nr:MOSC domain-containing protein [Agrobacterium sp. a22-2]NKN37952.1 MOSC domain-containing protein [Agrobacterium sp. a22-2]
MQVSELHIYPLKSARGIALTSSDVDAHGLVGDRRMMVVDPSGHFVTQRELPALATLTVTPGAGKVQLLLDDGRSVTTPLPDPDRRMDVAVWKSIVSAAVADDATNAALSDWLGRDLKLVHFDERARRIANPEWAGPDTPVTFADGYQVLITTTGSLNGLNADMQAHGEAPVGMDRFRPNIVIDCDEPWADDRWLAIEINGIRFDLVKPCARCIMTTQDQRTGSRDIASPMPAMGRLRMSADRRVPGPLFGWNATPRDHGAVAVGDTVTVISERSESWAIKRR